MHIIVLLGTKIPIIPNVQISDLHTGIRDSVSTDRVSII